MSGFVVLALSLVLVLQKWREGGRPQSVFYTALPLLIFSLFLIPYSMGRIDPVNLSRAGGVSVFAWAVALPLLAWSAFPEKTRGALTLCVALFGSLLGFGGASLPNLFATSSAKIHTPPLTDGAEKGVPNIGLATVDPAHLNRISRLNELLNSRLAPHETYLDLSSRNAHYFYLGRTPPIPVTAPYNLVPLAQQKRAVQRILAEPPKLALLEGDNINHDGGGIALRSPYLFRFIVNTYIPKSERGFIVGYRKRDAASTSENTITAEVNTAEVNTAEGVKRNDANWQQGINIKQAAFVLSDPFIVSLLTTEDYFRIGDGTTRRVIRVSAKESAVWLEGGPLPLLNDQLPETVQILTTSKTIRDYHASLFHRSFSRKNLKKIPLSWGRSEQTLRKKMTLVLPLDQVAPKLNQLAPSGSRYKVVGREPSATFDLSALKLSGEQAGLLRVNFECHGRAAQPKLLVFWWGDEREEAFEWASFKLAGGDGPLIIPFDASPWWLMLERVKGIRIALENPKACRELTINGVGLYQRIF